MQEKAYDSGGRKVCIFLQGKFSPKGNTMKEEGEGGVLEKMSGGETDHQEMHAAPCSNNPPAPPPRPYSSGGEGKETRKRDLRPLRLLFTFQPHLSRAFPGTRVLQG